MAYIPVPGGTGSSSSGGSSSSSAPVPGTTTSWHIVVLWFLGALALIALASPAPTIATMIVVLLIAATLLKNWSVYQAFLGL